MKLTAQMVKDAALRAGAGDIGIANIERFANAPRMMHPSNVFPECRSVITIVQPIPRGTYRGITEGTHWSNYTFYSYNRLNTLFRPAVTYETSCFIEDQGFEAVALYPGVPERPGLHEPVKPGRPAREINIHVRIAAVACGLGEIGWSKVFIHRTFGPRVRLGTILTDAELEPDPLLKPRTFCNRCMRCARDCPGGAIPKEGERPAIRIRIEDQTYEWGDVHMGLCTLTHHGMNWEASPFLKKDFPGLRLNVRETQMSEEAAYKLTYTTPHNHWTPSPEFPADAILPFYNQIKSHTSYFALCGAKGCIRACMATLEKRKCIGQCQFPTAVFPRPAWKLPPPEEDETGGIAEGKFPELYNQPDPRAGEWT
jgi:epoxyqueuosine reductase